MKCDVKWPKEDLSNLRVEDQTFSYFRKGSEDLCACHASYKSLGN